MVVCAGTETAWVAGTGTAWVAGTETAWVAGKLLDLPATACLSDQWCATACLPVPNVPYLLMEHAVHTRAACPHQAFPTISVLPVYHTCAVPAPGEKLVCMSGSFILMQLVQALLVGRWSHRGGGVRGAPGAIPPVLFIMWGLI